MCLGVPGRIDEVYREHGSAMARVDFGGVYKRVCLDCVPDAVSGDYVLVHVGFALAKIDELEAQRVFAMLAALDNGADATEQAT